MVRVLLKDFWFEQIYSIWTDITFIHEGNKTFLDNLVNFDKLVSQ